MNEMQTTDCKSITVDLGGMGHILLILNWTDHNCIPKQGKLEIRVIDGKPSILDIQFVETINTNKK